MCLHQYLHQKSTFLIQIQVLQSTAKLAQLSPMKTRKRLALDVFLPHVPSLFMMSLICFVRNGSTHGHVFMSLKKQQQSLSNMTRNPVKNCGFFCLTIPPFVSPLAHLCLEIFNPFMPRDFGGMLNT